ncbi:hypothetical protein QWJ26_40360 [Streptomyces sp. CSDS2]|uniref:hypothetical protein n=1 Tax=Streptomyces sp. CSDS2 TaxID=3055051 RepID=UPI0025AFBE68|nr:hypothetical protein [Streptomyces sp. CSDS2]MDN3265927.1 hypothetical protein [Streptomyces sp. CSDS2]
MIVDPAECNALSCTDEGLRVPETRVTGTSGPSPNANETIGVVVTPPAAGDCPQTYTVSAYAVLDPDECNALTSTSEGLRVPETRVTGTSGPAPGRIANAWQSIDVVVTPPAAADCPQNYAVRAYLTPLRGEAGPVGVVNLAPTRISNTWANTALQVTLPQPGVYLVTGDVDTHICAILDYASSTNLWTEVRLIDVESATVELRARQSAQHQFSTSPETRFQHCIHGPTSLSGLVTVSPAQGSKTVRVQAILHGGGPGNGLTNGATLQESTFHGPRSYLSYVKVAD